MLVDLPADEVSTPDNAGANVSRETTSAGE